MRHTAVDIPAEQQIRALLNRPCSIQKMMEAGADAIPSILPLQKQLTEIISNAEPAADRKDQLIKLSLRLCKQIMEQHGWCHAGCTFLPDNPLFDSAAFFTPAAGREDN